MRALYLASVWLHVLAAAAWIGGMVFLVLVLVPALRGRPFGAIRTELLWRVGLQLRRVGWVMLGLLVVTGLMNLAVLGVGWESVWGGSLCQGPWGSALLAKLGLVAVALALIAAHDFWIGPRAVTLMQEEPGSAQCRRYTRSARWMGRMMLVLSLVILALAVTLPRGGV